MRSLFTTETHDLEVCCQRVYACISLSSGALGFMQLRSTPSRCWSRGRLDLMSHCRRIAWLYLSFLKLLEHVNFYLVITVGYSYQGAQPVLRLQNSISTSTEGNQLTAWPILKSLCWIPDISLSVHHITTSCCLPSEGG